jgi:beta-mannanase
MRDDSMERRTHFESVIASIIKIQSDFEKLTAVINKNNEEIINNLQEKHQRQIEEIQATRKFIHDLIQSKHN